VTFDLFHEGAFIILIVWSILKTDTNHIEPTLLTIIMVNCIVFKICNAHLVIDVKHVFMFSTNFFYKKTRFYVF